MKGGGSLNMKDRAYLYYIANYQSNFVSSDIMLKYIVKTIYRSNYTIWKRNKYGKKILIYPRICYSISKSKNYMICCISLRNIGIDFEEYTNFKIALDKLISIMPSSVIVSNSNFDSIKSKQKYYFSRWCQIESLYKLIGTGIRAFPCDTSININNRNICEVDNKVYYFFYPKILEKTICCVCSDYENVEIYVSEFKPDFLKEDFTMIDYEINNLNFSKIDNIKEGTIFDRANIAYEYLKHEYQNHNLFTRRVSLTGSAPEVEIYDVYTKEFRKMIYFASNDYLNLTKHPKTIEAGIEAIKKYGSGAGSVPILGGTTDLHIKLEEKVAKFKGCEASIAYSSGFGSNCGTLLALLKKSDLAILDMYVHASIVDGCKNTNIEYFLHNDMKHLEKILKRSYGKYNTVLVIVDGVYSMDGDIAPLDQIVEITKRYNGFVMVDEAHATGVIGKNGKGTPEYFNLEGKIDIVAGTFSKGIGAVGGFIASSKELIEMIRYYSRPYMFSTAITPQASASIIAALEIIENDNELRNSLWTNIMYLREKLVELGFNLGNSETAIFPIIIGDDEKTKAVCRYLHQNGVYANLVLFPAVPKELSRIRISVMANHTKEHLDRLIYLMKQIGKDLDII